MRVIFLLSFSLLLWQKRSNTRVVGWGPSKCAEIPIPSAWIPTWAISGHNWSPRFTPALTCLLTTIFSMWHEVKRLETSTLEHKPRSLKGLVVNGLSAQGPVGPDAKWKWGESRKKVLSKVLRCKAFSLFSVICSRFVKVFFCVLSKTVLSKENLKIVILSMKFTVCVVQCPF